MKILENENLAKYTTIKIGGIAEKFYIPESKDELINLVNELNNQKIYLIGGGSNLLINDKKVFESVISLREFDNLIKSLGNGKYYVGASVRLQKLINFINSEGYGGIEYLYSLPALTGGAIAMNAGRGKAYNLCISDHIEQVTVYDYENHELKKMSKEKCDFSYRESVFKENKFIVLGAIFNFKPVSQEESSNRKKERIAHVKNLQDNSGYNFGSVFRKYNKYIMQITRIMNIGNKNGVKFSNKTSNWILNDGSGSYEQVCNLTNKIIKLHEMFNFNIKLEVIKWD